MKNLFKIICFVIISVRCNTQNNDLKNQTSNWQDLIGIWQIDSLSKANDEKRFAPETTQFMWFRPDGLIDSFEGSINDKNERRTLGYYKFSNDTLLFISLKSMTVNKQPFMKHFVTIENNHMVLYGLEAPPGEEQGRYFDEVFTRLVMKNEP